MSVFTNPSTRAADDAAAYVNAVLELVGDRDPLEVLRETPEALRVAIVGLPLDKLRQPEREGKWSIVHVLQHLADADIVWAWRMRLILAQDRPTTHRLRPGSVGRAPALRRHRSERGAGAVRCAPARQPAAGLTRNGGGSGARRRPRRAWRRESRPSPEAVRRTRSAAPAADRANPPHGQLRRASST